MLTLHALGGLDLRDEAGEPIEALLRQPKRLALLVYLALAEPAGFHRRDTILLLFWPDLTAERARAALRKSLHVLRGAVGPEVILTRGDDELGIDWQHLTCDVTMFTSALTAGRTVEALSHYSADLLTGFYLSDASPEWEQWLDGRRQELRSQAAAAAWAHADALTEVGEVAEGVRWARWACERTPDDEPAIRRLLTLLGRLGDRAGALQCYEQFRTRLRADYGAQPAPETQELVRELKTRVMVEAPILPPPAPPQKVAAAPRDPIERPPVHSAPPQTVTPPPQPTSRRYRSVLAIVSLVLLMIAFGITTWPTAKPIDSDLVAIAPFSVLSPDLEVWGEGVVDVLIRNLDGAGPLRAVPPGKALALATRGGEESAAEFGERTGAGLVISGVILGLAGDSIRVSAGVLDRTTGDQVGSIDIDGATDRMDMVIDSLTRQLLRTIGAVRRVGSGRYAGIGSRSVPALKEFLRGEQFRRRTGWDSARVHYEAALGLDTAFAMAWLRLGEVNNMSRFPAPLAIGTRAEDPWLQVARAGRFNRGLSQHDSMIVDMASTMAMILTNQVPEDQRDAEARRAYQVALKVATEYPDDAESWFAVAVVQDQLGGQLPVTNAQALASYAKAIAFDSGFAPAVRLALRLAGDGGDVELTQRLAEHYLTLDPAPSTREIPQLIAAVLSPHHATDSAHADLHSGPIETLYPTLTAIWRLPDSGEAAIRIARASVARGHDPRYWFTAEHITRRNMAAVLAYRGHVEESLALIGGERGTWFANLLGELAMLGAVPQGFADSVFAAWTAARDGTWGGLDEAPAWWADHRDTTAILRYLARRTPGGTRGDSAYLSLARGDSATALRQFEGEGWLPFPSRLRHVRLLTAAGRAADALAILEGREPNDWAIPSQVVWRMERARLAEQLGMPDAARRDYEFVTEVWRHADPLLQPIVTEALGALRNLGSAGTREQR